MKIFNKILINKYDKEIDLYSILNNILLERKLIDNIYEIASSHSDSTFLIADSNTVNLINKNTLEKFDHYIIPNPYTSSTRLVNCIKKKSKDKNLLIALGSGTINDICKYISYEENKDYILFPTAASMNGYVSTNSSIELPNGFKKSFRGKLAKAIYIDIDIIVNAPLKLTTSGFADFICRSTAQADWLLSHLLLDTEYTELPFLLTQEIEEELIKENKGLKTKDETTILLLVKALLFSGLGMSIAKSSCPASQGEHMIASCMELITNNSNLLHGEKIAVTTLTMASIQEKILSLTKPYINTTSLPQKNITSIFSKNHSKEFLEIYDSKFIDQNRANYLNCIINDKWQNIVKEIKKNFLQPKRIQQVLKNIGCPITIEELSWKKKDYKKIVNLSFTTKDRFTFLDLAHHIDKTHRKIIGLPK